MTPDTSAADANRATLERANAAVVDGDHEGFLSWCTDDTEWTFVGDRVLRGKDEVRRWMADAYGEPPRLTVDQMIAEHDSVAATGTVTTRNDGRDVSYAYCDVWRFRGGRMASLRAFVIETQVDA